MKHGALAQQSRASSPGAKLEGGRGIVDWPAAKAREAKALGATPLCLEGVAGAVARVVEHGGRGGLVLDADSEVPEPAARAAAVEARCLRGPACAIWKWLRPFGVSGGPGRRLRGIGGGGLQLSPGKLGDKEGLVKSFQGRLPGGQYEFPVSAFGLHGTS